MAKKAPSAALLALVQPGDRDTVAGAAEAARLEVVAVATLSDLLARLASSKWGATLVSMSAEHVDEDVVRRVAEQAGTGELLVSATGASLPRALAMRAIGAVGLLREPIDEAELRSRLLAVADEGRHVALPEPPPSREDAD